MTAFRFRLETVLAGRRTQAQLAEMEFRREAAALAALDQATAELEARGIQTEAEVRDWSPLEGSDLAALGAFRRSVERQTKDLAARRTAQTKKLAEREQAMVDARRRCRLLERLRERRLAEWQSESDRELEQAAADSYLARLARESSIMKE